MFLGYEKRNESRFDFKKKKKKGLRDWKRKSWRKVNFRPVPFSVSSCFLLSVLRFRLSRSTCAATSSSTFLLLLLLLLLLLIFAKYHHDFLRGHIFPYGNVLFQKDFHTEISITIQ